jgi:hypothetical protein
MSPLPVSARPPWLDMFLGGHYEDSPVACTGFWCVTNGELTCRVTGVGVYAYGFGSVICVNVFSVMNLFFGEIVCISSSVEHILIQSDCTLNMCW